MNLNSRDQSLFDELMAALHSAQALPQVMSRSWELMLQLISADYVALCISKPGRPAEYDWLVTGGPASLLAQYSELAPGDFVRPAVVSQPGIALRDTDILPRKKMERSLVYQRSRELHLALEQVMAIMLPLGADRHAGLTFYRDRRRPFSLRERALLQHLARHLVNAIRNCLSMEDAVTGRHLLEAVLQRHGDAYVVVSPPSVEQLRAPRATALLEKWFASSVPDASGLPRDLLEHLRMLMGMDEDARLAEDTLFYPGKNENLVVKFVQLPEQGGTRRWAMVFHELSQSLPLPKDLRRRLTPCQIEVLQCVLRNWEDKTIAGELRISPWTVKTHVRDSFKRLGIDSRADLMYQAARLLRPV